MRPLYWILYKSPNEGLFEYLCAAALYQISAFDFRDESGRLTWQNTHEFLQQFTAALIQEREQLKAEGWD